MYKKGKKMPQAQYEGKRETMEEVSKYKILGVKGQFSTESAKFFGVRTAVSEQDGQTPTASYYPYYDQGGTLTGYKKRDWTVPKDHDHHFSVIGVVRASSQMFGQHKFGEGARRIICVEGEGDVMATWHLLEKYKEVSGKAPSIAVVGLNTGCVNAQKSATANEKYLLSGETLVLGLDNDERHITDPKTVKRGKEATEDMFSVLLSQKVRVVHWPDECKDAKDYAGKCLRDSNLKGFNDLVLYGGRKYTGEKIIKAADIPLEKMFEKKPLGVFISSFPKWMNQLRGLRKGEFGVVTAPSGAGKTTIVSEVLYQCAEEGEKVGLIMLEQPAEESVKRLVARQLEVPFDKFDFDPLSCANKEDITAAYNHVTDPENDSYTLVNHFGSLQVQEVMNKIKTLTYVDECDYIIVDHLSMVISGLETTDERKELDILLTHLAAFTAANPVGILAVAHLNRKGTSESFKRPAGVPLDQPFWVEVKKEDLRGSASLEQLPHWVMALEPEIMPDRTRGRLRLVMLKNRTTRVTGTSDILRMDDSTGLMIDASDEDTGDDEPL